MNIFPVVSIENISKQVIHPFDCLAVPDSFFVYKPGFITTPEKLGLQFYDKSYEIFHGSPDAGMPLVGQNTNFEVSKTTFAHIRNAVLIPNTGHLIKDGITIQESYAPTGFFDSCLRVLHGYYGYDKEYRHFDFNKAFSDARAFANFKFTNLTHFEEPVFLLSNERNDRTFFHWMNLRLPELHVFSNIMNGRLNLAISYDLEKWQLDSITTLFKGRQIRLIKFDSPVVFESLYRVFYSSSNFQRIDYDYYQWLSNSVGVISKNQLPKKVYLSRSDVGRRSYINEQEFTNLLAKFSVDRILMSNLPFSTQINIIKNADLIIMPEGSAHTFLPYVNKNCLILWITNSNISYHHSQIDLAFKLYGLHSAHILHKMVTRVNEFDNDSDLIIDTIGVHRFLQTLF
jgi:hypothetical protein